MFKIAEELMQKIKEAVAINEPVLAVGYIMQERKCTNCNFSCKSGCKGTCKGIVGGTAY